MLLQRCRVTCTRRRMFWLDKLSANSRYKIMLVANIEERDFKINVRVCDSSSSRQRTKNCSLQPLEGLTPVPLGPWPWSRPRSRSARAVSQHTAGPGLPAQSPAKLGLRPSYSNITSTPTSAASPIECKMSIEASRSVLRRDWALWNSTTAAAAIFPIQTHSPTTPRGMLHQRVRRARSIRSLLGIVV